MKKTKYNALKELVSAPYCISGFSKNSKTHDFLVTLLKNGRVYTGYYRGYGRRSTAVDCTCNVCNQLDKLGIAYKTGNDAPRGGVSGNFVEITMPAFIKEVKKVIALRKASEETAREEQEKKREAARIHKEWVEVEAAKFDIEKYRSEITTILKQMGRSIPTSPKKKNHLTRKECGKIIWHLTKAHKELNSEILKQALQKYEIVKIHFNSIKDFDVVKNNMSEEKSLVFNGYTHEDLVSKARQTIEWVTDEYKDDIHGRYWLNVYHGAEVYELIIQKGRIVGSICEGFYPTIPKIDNHKVISREQWIGVLTEVVRERIGDSWHFVKADGSGCAFFLREETDDDELRNYVKKYKVPEMQYGGMHTNYEITATKQKRCDHIETVAEVEFDWSGIWFVKCPTCGKIVASDTIGVPIPDWTTCQCSKTIIHINK